MTMLVTLEQGKAHLYLDGTDHDLAVTEAIEDASASVISYLKVAANEFLDSSGLLTLDSSGNIVLDSPGVVIPFQVRRATLLMLTALWESRGDDGGEAAKFAPGYLPPAVTAILYPLRDPALA